MPKPRKLALIPRDTKAWLEQALVARAYGDIEGITAELNELLARAGVGFTVGKSAVGEESLRIKRAQEAIAAATRSMQLIADTARDDADKRGEAVNAMVSTHLFEALLDASAAGAEADPSKRIALMNKAALAAGRLSTTSVNQRQWRHQVEERAKAAAEAVTKIAKTGGMSANQVAEIRRQILGISKTTPKAEQAATTPAT
jgi:protein-disulfide isomerase-like protein with CxxC motif